MELAESQRELENERTKVSVHNNNNMKDAPDSEPFTQTKDLQEREKIRDEELRVVRDQADAWQSRAVNAEEELQERTRECEEWSLAGTAATDKVVTATQQLKAVTEERDGLRTKLARAEARANEEKAAEMAAKAAREARRRELEEAIKYVKLKDKINLYNDKSSESTSNLNIKSKSSESTSNLNIKSNCKSNCSEAGGSRSGATAEGTARGDNAQEVPAAEEGQVRGAVPPASATAAANYRIPKCGTAHGSCAAQAAAGARAQADAPAAHAVHAPAAHAAHHPPAAAQADQQVDHPAVDMAGLVNCWYAAADCPEGDQCGRLHLSYGECDHLTNTQLIPESNHKH